ncbi:hypothetical protein CTH_1102 [Carboxydocella thermautotrophica]|nr:hypothetical protein CTH_1102 [Carboxydocella thermautotrophica]
MFPKRKETNIKGKILLILLLTSMLLSILKTGIPLTINITPAGIYIKFN